MRIALKHSVLQGAEKFPIKGKIQTRRLGQGWFIPEPKGTHQRFGQESRKQQYWDPSQGIVSNQSSLPETEATPPKQSGGSTKSAYSAGSGNCLRPGMRHKHHARTG